MTLNYDVDITYIFPEEFFTNTSGGLAGLTGIQLNSRANYRALFRDPRTAAALANESNAFKAYMEECGFGFVSSGLTFPKGYYDEKFENHMADLITRMSDKLVTLELPEKAELFHGTNEFSLIDLSHWFVASQPMTCNSKLADRSPLPRPTSGKWVGVDQPSYSWQLFVLGLCVLVAYLAT
ncbi:MAG: hypothetical protein AAGH83_09055 [Pseudomonadota bacterium]